VTQCHTFHIVHPHGVTLIQSKTVHGLTWHFCRRRNKWTGQNPFDPIQPNRMPWSDNKTAIKLDTQNERDERSFLRIKDTNTTYQYHISFAIGTNCSYDIIHCFTMWKESITSSSVFDKLNWTIDQSYCARTMETWIVCIIITFASTNDNDQQHKAQWQNHSQQDNKPQWHLECI
jgi:hypothetical protein